MTAKTTIGLLMKANRITQVHMAQLLGVSSQKVIWRRMNSENMTVNTILEFLDAMDYELVIRERRGGRRREDEIIITQEDDGEIVL